MQQLETPRAIWIMVPAAVVQPTLDQLRGLLQADDIVIDGGNSYYRDDITRAEALKTSGIHYVDCGTSGGVWGLDRGYCLMIGGETEPVERLGPIFKTIAPGAGSAEPTVGRTRTDGTAQDGYLHCGPSGAGHFVKMVHNGIEYGMMAAIAEGLNIIAHANEGSQDRPVDAETTPLRDPWAYRFEIDVAEVAEVWRRGSVVGSWLVDLTADALARSPEARRLRRTGVGLRGGALDGRRRHRHGRARRRHHDGAVRALPVPRARATSRTSSSRPCGPSSGGTRRSRRRRPDGALRRRGPGRSGRGGPGRGRTTSPGERGPRSRTTAGSTSR